MITLRIPDMSCSHCVKTIDSAVKTVDPAATTEADLSSHTVKVASKADNAALRQVIEAAGYDNEILAI